MAGTIFVLSIRHANWRTSWPVAFESPTDAAIHANQLFDEPYVFAVPMKGSADIAQATWEGEVGDPLTVDHINRDRLDNRLVNLRVCRRAENNQNRRARRVYETPGGRYEAKVQVDGVRHYLGTFATEPEAQQAVITFQASIQHPFLTARRHH